MSKILGKNVDGLTWFVCLLLDQSLCPERSESCMKIKSPFKTIRKMGNEG